MSPSFPAANLNYKSFAVVLDAATLRRVATIKPVSTDELANVEGVTQAKVTKFGQSLLDVTTNYAALAMSKYSR